MFAWFCSVGCLHWVTGRVQTVWDAAPEGRLLAELRESNYICALKVYRTGNMCKRTKGPTRALCGLYSTTLQILSNRD